MSLLNVTQFEAGGCVGVDVEVLAAERRGASVGVGVVIWLGMNGIGIEVGVGEGRELLWFSESLAMELDDEERVGVPASQAASKTINERHNRLQ